MVVFPLCLALTDTRFIFIYFHWKWVEETSWICGFSCHRCMLKVTAIYGVVDTGSVLHYVLLSLSWVVWPSDSLLLD
jgi:hypothetical protein